MTRELTHLHVVAGPGGWVRASWRRGKQSAEHSAYLRFDPRLALSRAGRSVKLVKRTARTRGQRWPVVELRLGGHVNAELLREIPVHRIEVVVLMSKGLRPTLEEWLEREVPANLDEAFAASYREVPRLKLKRPAGRRLDDDFYREVAFAYRDAVERGLNPGKTLAEDSGVPRGTVNRWIAKARSPELSYLPPGEPGKVTA
jgi:hypothetical protein